MPKSPTPADPPAVPPTSAISNDPGTASVMPRSRNRRGHGGQLRNELIDAASALLEAGGTEAGVTLRAVTRRAGVAPQAFYLQFNDTDELLWAVYAAAFQRFEAALSSAETNHAKPDDALRARCEAHCTYAADHPASYRLLFGTIGSYKPQWNPDELPGSATFQAWHRTISRCIDAGQARNCDPFMLTITLIGALHGLVMLQLNRPSFPWPPLNQLVDDVLTNQIGLTTPSAGMGMARRVPVVVATQRKTSG
jgi:AcrR family transcriptional regulator